MKDETRNYLTVLLVRIAHSPNFSRESLMADIKRLIAGESPEVLLGPEEQMALSGMQQECVTGVATSDVVAVKRDL